MLSVTITEKDGPSTTTTFDKTEVLIGRVKGNDVVLPKTNVSKRHSRIVVKDGKIILIDLKSTNGTFINGRKINGPHVMQEGDKVFIGDFTLEVKEIAGNGAMGSSAPIGLGAPVPGYNNVPAANPLPQVNPVQPMAPHMGADLSHNPGVGMPAANQPNFSRPGMNAPVANPAMGLGGHQIQEPVQNIGVGPINNMGVEANVPMGPGLNGPAAGMAPAPSLSQPAQLAGPAQINAGASSLGGASVQPIGVSPVGARSLPSAQPVKQSNISAPVGEGVIDKSLRLSGQGSASSGKAGSAARQNKKDFTSAALPEDIIVDDARNAETEAWLKAARAIMDKYLTEHDFQSVAAQPYPPEAALQDTCYNNLSKCAKLCRSAIGSANVDSLLDFLLKEACGLGVIDSLIDDADVTAFTVYNFETIVVDRKGRRELSSLQFTSADTLYLAAQRLLAFQGINPQTAPAVSEIRFGDGTQIEVILPPVSVASTTIVVRKTCHEFSDLTALVQKGMLSVEMDKFLKLCVKARRNILVVGAQGSGRTSILNALGAEIPDGERIVTVENSAMLVMPQVYVISLEAQNASFQGGDLSTLMRQTSKLRAERVLADTLQSPADTTAFLNAICAGAQGSMATMCALNATEGFRMFKRMVTSDTPNSSLANNIDIIVTVRAFTNAKRRIVEIAEVSTEDGEARIVPIFGWMNSGMGNMAMGDGQFKAIGNVPQFYRDLERGGMALDTSIFNV